MLASVLKRALQDVILAGLIRQHQFNKVELVKFVKPEDSYEELEKLTGHAEKVLQLLELPYRVLEHVYRLTLVSLLQKNMILKYGCQAMIRIVKFLLVHNFEAFQARRANIRFRREPKAKPEYVHTLNGSGLAIGRTVAAILKTTNRKMDQLVIPEVLRPYMGNREIIVKR